MRDFTTPPPHTPWFPSHPAHVIVADTVLHVAKEMMRYGPEPLLECRCFAAALLLGGYVNLGTLDYDRAFELLEYTLPSLLDSPCFHRMSAALQAGLRAGMALGLTRPTLDTQVREWCNGDPPDPAPDPEDLSHLLAQADQECHARTPPKDFIDLWLGPRTTWNGVPLAVRKVDHGDAV
jgi:hypothetical protein